MAYYWREHKSVLVHRESMMDSVNVEMERVHEVVLKEVWHPILLSVEYEPVEEILAKGPE